VVAEPRSNTTLLEVVKEINYDNIEKHINTIWNLGSRVTGYPGFYATAKYVEDYFEKLGLQVYKQSFKLAIPLEVEGKLIVEGIRYPVHVLWPNVVALGNTPPEGVAGQIIYVGKGSLKEFYGKDVKDTIVLMDFDCGYNWINAIRLGASAVIFVESDSMLRYDAFSKLVIGAPLDFPRGYVEKQVIVPVLRKILSGEKVYGKVILKAGWKQVEAYNIVGILPGESSDDFIVVSAHYDTWGIVPALPTSLDEATNIGVLLELARVLSQKRLKRTLVFVALAGHWQGLAGAREFVRQFILPKSDEGKRVWMEIGLDLSTDSYGVTLVHAGFFNKFGLQTNYIARFTWIGGKINKEYWFAIKDYVMKFFPYRLLNESALRIGFSKTGTTLNFPWWDTSPITYMLDTEISFIAGLPSFTIRTQHSYRSFWHVPRAFKGEFNIESLRSQVPIALAIIYGLANEPESSWGLNWGLIQPRRFGIQYQYRVFQGFVPVNGEVVVYNFTTGWYSSIRGRALVRMRTTASMLPMASFFNFTEENGKFHIDGIAPYDPVSGVITTFDAWIFDENWKVRAVTNIGLFGTTYARTWAKPLQPIADIVIPVIEAVPVTMIDIINPQTMRRMVLLDPRYLDHVFLSEGAGIKVFDFTTGGDVYMYSMYFSPWEGIAVLFIPQGYNIGIMIYRLDVYGRPIPVVNASEEMPEGSGFLVNKPVYLTMRNYARDVVYLVKNRYSRVARFQFRSYSAEFLIRNATNLLSKADEYFSKKEYSKAYISYMRAWAWGLRAYTESMNLIDDSGRTSVFFFLLILMSAILLERLLIGLRGRKVLISISAFTVVFLIAFYFIHPALRIISTSYVAMLGILTLLVFSIVAFIFFGQGAEIARTVSKKLLGYHEYEVTRVGMLMAASSISIENLKKRPLRTSLTLLSIIVVTAALTSLSSVSYYTKLTYLPQVQEASYNGYLLKQGDMPIWYDHYLVAYLDEVFSNRGEVYPRIWYYPETWWPYGVRAIVEGRRGIALVYAFLGIREGEANKLVELASLAGDYIPDPFKGGGFKCIISKRLSQVLGVELGDVIRVHGLNLTVVGIVNEQLLEGSGSVYKELDGYPISPLSPEMIPDLEMMAGLARRKEVYSFNPLSWSLFIVIPYDLATRLGGYPASISIRLTNVTSFEKEVKMAEDLVYPLREIDVYMGWEKGTYMLGESPSFLAFGYESLVVIFIIAAANVAIAMLGSIKERAREINVYSVVGMSPTAVAVLFVSEGIIIALIGTVLGFYLGFTLDILFYNFGITPEYFIRNYASGFVIIGLLISIIAVIIPSLYPSLMAAKKVTPSLERKWTIPTKPRGDEWQIPLPFSIPSRREVVAILRYLKEYYTGSGAIDRAYRILDVIKYDENNYYIRLHAHLAPFELNIHQEVEVRAVKVEKAYNFNLYIRKISGARDSWIRSNRIFIDRVRKQLLVWRTLPSKEKEKYYFSS